MQHGKHKFVANFLNEARFEGGGLRGYFEDRDLGISEATGGEFFAQVHRAAGRPPREKDVHYHTTQFQMNYVLKGWCVFEFEGEGTFTFNAGDSWLQPPGIRHALVDFSEDFEVLEVCAPGDFETHSV